MSHLLAISVGPVQEFIAAARRTRDLWFGSFVLSEISRAVARAVAERGGKLIFPASLDDENIANVILAELTEGDARAIAEAARDAARTRWLEFADDVRERYRADINLPRWDAQASDVIEFYAAWVETTGNYPTDRRSVMRLLAGRKNCRDFSPGDGQPGVPKSSLDGQRESVLRDPAHKPRSYGVSARLRTGEQLDVVGLIKRLGEGKRSYPSVARVAVDPWVRGLAERCPAQLATLIRLCDELDHDLIHRLDMNGHSQFGDFPYEGTALYLDRHHDLIDEASQTERKEDREVVRNELLPLRKVLEGLPTKANPYLAVLVADGDKVGASISRLESAADNRTFSLALAGFAGAAREIVKGHNGILVYAGGDDVLAFVPVDQALKCARDLHSKFSGCMGRYKSTLSVGIAIGHFMEPLEDLLNHGRAAEKAAKKVPDKDALAVHLHKRGGAPITIAGKWNDGIDGRLTIFAELLNADAIPSRLPYEMLALSRVYAGWPDADMAIRCDLFRLIEKKRSKGETSVRESLEPYLSRMNADNLRTLGQEILVARQLATAMRQAQPRRKP